MKRRHPLLLAVLIALAIAAFAATSASAATTAYSCAQTTKEVTFTDAHCKTKGVVAIGYKHVALPSLSGYQATDFNTASETTASTVSKIKGKFVGIEMEFQCLATNGSGLVSNSETAGGEMFAHLSGSLSYSFCTVTKPAGKGCTLPSPITLPFTATTQGQGAALKVTPVKGTEFGKFTLSGCSLEALNQALVLSGSYVMTPSGATVTTTHAGVTAQGTLFLAGSPAGLEQSLTLQDEKIEGLAFT